jgi:hypothetical protein
MIQIPSDFPNLDTGQCVVVQVDPRTGIHLARNGIWAKTGDAFYRAFSSLSEAEAFCLERVGERRDTEWWIFNDRGVPIKSFSDSEYWRTVAAREASNRSKGFWHRLLNLFKVRR